MTRKNPPDPHPQTAAHKSLGLNTTLRLLREDRDVSILDLGPALGANVEFWSRYQSRLYIQDFYRGYTRGSAENPDAPGSDIISSLLELSNETTFDVVLAWDLFNYLSLEALETLIRSLSPHCRPGTALFALISSQAQISATPTLFRIMDMESLGYEPTSQETRQCSRHQPRDLAKVMGRFQVSSSFLLRNGVQEYVFVFSESGP